MIQIPLTKDQYWAVLQHLNAAKAPDVLKFSLPSETEPGLIENAQISLNFTYNGTDALDVTILAKHGLARFASEGTIKAHLVDLLGKV